MALGHKFVSRHTGWEHWCNVTALWLPGRVVLPPTIPWLARQPFKVDTNRSHYTDISDFPVLPSHSSLSYVSLNTMALCSFETSRNDYQVTRRFTAEERGMLNHTTMTPSRFATGSYTKIGFSWRCHYDTAAHFTLPPASASTRNHYQFCNSDCNIHNTN